MRYLISTWLTNSQLYAIQSMYLELDLLDSFRIPREPDPLPVPPKSRQSFDLPHALTEDTGFAPRRASARDRERRERTRSFFHRLGKDTRGLFDGLLGRRHLPEDHPPAAIPPRSETLDVISIERPSTPMSISYQSITSDKSGLGLPGAQTPPVQLPTEKHLAMLSRLEDLLPSTTPGLKSPMPPLLLRVREEELVRREMAKEEMKEEGTSTIDGLPVLRGPGEGTVRGTDSPRGRALAYRLGGDVRSGLGALAPGPDTFAGWTRLQKLDVLYCVGIDDRPVTTALESDTSNGNGDETKPGAASKSTFCQRPEQESHTFYDPSSDVSLEDFFERLSADAGDMAACDRAGCDVVGGEHVRWWIHGGRKIEGKVQSLQSGVVAGPAEQLGETNGQAGIAVDEGSKAAPGIEAWVRCGQCGKESEARGLTDLAR
jgi:1-phosphatidylinositol-3-phosphate 5-kinase